MNGIGQRFHPLVFSILLVCWPLTAFGLAADAPASAVPNSPDAARAGRDHVFDDYYVGGEESYGQESCGVEAASLSWTDDAPPAPRWQVPGFLATWFGPDPYLDHPWTLFPQRAGRLYGGGWTAVGYHTAGVNRLGAAGPFGDFRQGGLGLFNNYPHHVQLQQQWLFVERRPIRSDSWDWGLRVDYLYGTDGPDAQAVGGRPHEYDNRWDHGFAYGHALPQLFGQVVHGRWTFSGGHMLRLLGYESLPAVQNFFSSHSYSLTELEPLTLTGAIAEYQADDQTTVYGGWSLGWDSGFSETGNGLFVGGVRRQWSPDLSASYLVTGGDIGYGGGHSVYAHSIVVDWLISGRCEYVLQSDLVSGSQFAGPRGPQGDAITINQYCFYKLTDRLKAGLRAEWWDNRGLPDQVSTFTFGLNWRPQSNILLRPEMRSDQFGPGLATANLRDSTVFGCDAVVTF